MRLAVEYTFLPDPVDVGFLGTGSAVGGVIGGLWAYFFGYSLEDVAKDAALASMAAGGAAAGLWLLGLIGLDLLS
jgi:hypothetical protein